MKKQKAKFFFVLFSACSVIMFVISNLHAQIVPSPIIRVPEDYPTIQQAIQTASDFDSISVKKGTYDENINFLGKKIKVYSRSGKDQTIIKGDNTSSVVTFNGGETSAAKLIGFTITNGIGTSNYGGGIICTNNSSPLIKDNIITANYDASYGFENGAKYGGGIACVDGSNPTIELNTISWNGQKSGGSQGGGIGCWNSTPTIKENTIINNIARWGGGVFMENAPADFYMFRNSIGSDGYFIGPNLAQFGGGVYISYSNGTLEENLITENEAKSSYCYGGTQFLGLGGGIYLEYCDEIVIDEESRIINNEAELSGGGIFVMDSDKLIIRGSDVNYNKTWGRDDIYYTPGGAGIYAWGCGLEICYSTIKGNWDQWWGFGGGIFSWQCSSVSITGSRIEANRVHRSGAGIYYNNSNSVAVQDIVNNLIVDNIIFDPGFPYGKGGSGIFIELGAPIITNNTITKNDIQDITATTATGGGLYCVAGSAPVVTNTIVWENGLSLNVNPPEAREIYAEPGATLLVNYSDVWVPNYPNKWPGNFNQNEDPQFIDLSYRIEGGTPSISICIDTGNIGGPSAPAVDFELDYRPTDGDDSMTDEHDIGWDEYIPG